jgi:uncharacterized protein
MQIYLPIAEMPLNMLLVLALGAAVGFVSGLFGVGGGFLMTPLLIFLGVSPAVAVATQSAQIAASSTTGVLAALRRGAVDIKLGTVLISGGVIGTLLGIVFFRTMRRLGQLELVITVSYVTLFGIVGSLMLMESIRALTKPKDQMAQLPSLVPASFDALPLRVRFAQSGLETSLVPVIALAVFIGFAGAVMGIGGGFILVPALLYFFRVPTATAIGTSQFLILFTMLAATILHAIANESVDIVLAILLIIGGVFGAQFGARAGRKLDSELFRLLLALLILGVGLRFALELVLPPRDAFSIGSGG